MSKLDKILEMKKQFDEEVAEYGKDALLDELKNFFKQNPEIKGISWEQYTPYFNDGEECVFSVHEAIFTTNDETVRACLEDGDSPSEDYDDKGDGWWSVYSKNRSKVKANCRELNGKLQDLQDVLKVAFGDHVQIIVTPATVEVREYDHE